MTPTQQEVISLIYKALDKTDDAEMASQMRLCETQFRDAFPANPPTQAR